MADLRDIAAAAGVSPSVVSRVLRGDPQARVRDSTRQRIITMAAKLGYVANQRSLSLRFGRSAAIGLIVPDVSNAAFADLLTGVEKAAHLRKISVLLTQLERGPAGLDSLRTLVKQGRVDGLLIQRREDYDPEVLQRGIAPGLPLVLVNSMLPNRVGSVILDDVRGAALAVQHLIDLGHRDIAHVSGPSSLDTAQRRRQGYEQAVKAAGPRVEAGMDHRCGLGSLRGRAGRQKIIDAHTAAHRCLCRQRERCHRLCRRSSAQWRSGASRYVRRHHDNVVGVRSDVSRADDRADAAANCRSPRRRSADGSSGRTTAPRHCDN